MARIVEATQPAIHALPPDSGEWKVKGVLGLFVYAGKRGTSYYLQRRIAGRLVRRRLAAETLAQAKREAIRVWRSLQPVATTHIPTLEEALLAYLESKHLRPATRQGYVYAIRHYLQDWLRKRLDLLALDRAGFRQRMLEIQRRHGAATARQVIVTYRAIHNWHKKVLPDLPESPTVACEMPRLKPRDWALDDGQLRQWWAGVQQLPVARRVWWLTALLTGARAGSVTALRWGDVDLQRQLIRFRVAKGDRPYTIPMPDRLARILAEYRDKDWLPNGDGFVFPSPRREGAPYSRSKPAGVPSPHHLRHTMRTRLAEAGCTPDLAHIALGHVLPGVSGGYVTAHLLIEAVRPLLNAVADRYAEILGWDSGTPGGESHTPSQACRGKPTGEGQP